MASVRTEEYRKRVAEKYSHLFDGITASARAELIFVDDGSLLFDKKFNS